MKQSFTLQPFEPDDLLLSIYGFVEYQQGLLEVHYALQGDLSQVLLPPAVDIPGRKFALWEATCLEFFLATTSGASEAIVSQTDYWEFNLAPNGNWQVFHLNDYREGLKDEAAINYLPFAVKQDAQGLQLDLLIDLTCLFPPDTKLEMAITAVIQSAANEYSYWSLQHSGEEADFHRRDDFAIKLG